MGIMVDKGVRGRGKAIAAVVLECWGKKSPRARMNGRKVDQHSVLELVVGTHFSRRFA